MRWWRSLCNRARFTYQLASNRFTARVLAPDEIPTAIALRRDVFGSELGRIDRGTAVSPGDTDVLDPCSLHFGCFDNGTQEMIGSLRLTPALALRDAPAYAREYHVAQIDADVLAHTHVAARLAVRSAYRRSPAALLLNNLCFETSVRACDSWMGLLTAEPPLYPMYMQFGWRPFARCFNSALGGYRVPMFLLPHDYAMLRRTASPFFAVAKSLGFPPAPPRAAAWAAQFAEPIDPGVAPVDVRRWREYACQLFRGISPRGCQELLRGAMHIRAALDDRVLAKGDGGAQPGYLVRGRLRVIDGRRELGTIEPGMIFGEFAQILGIPRTADVIVDHPDTEFVLFRRYAFASLSSAEDRVALWRNLAISLVHTVIRKAP